MNAIVLMCLLSSIAMYISTPKLILSGAKLMCSLIIAIKLTKRPLLMGFYFNPVPHTAFIDA